MSVSEVRTITELSTLSPETRKEVPCVNMNILYNPTGCSTTSFIRPHLGRSRQHEYPIQSNRLQYNEFHPSSSGRQHEYPIQSNRLQYNEFHPSSSGGIDQRIS
ncbi:unnamed protein product [Protopolystoma xenopodis]|uniref:Uncharacterized protein n=1 Tax=Protopolystoma xenopodis TaxID=117903 RepID=A0A448X0P7_9PLAT|nr:unnamed protein product [Protopolystoma xenopodis]